MKPVYEKLVEAMPGGGLPLVKCEELERLLQELFTEEEAAMAAVMPHVPITSEKLSAKLSRDPHEVAALLDDMARHGLISGYEHAGDKYYRVVTLLPGLIEYSFMRGEVNERTRRIAQLLQDYFDYLPNAPKQPVKEAQRPTRSPFRVIAVEQEIPTGYNVQLYDKLAPYIDNAELIAVATCYCHHFEELRGNHCCDSPKEVCMMLNRFAKHIIDYGFGHEITRDQARKLLREAEEAGLVHCASNTGEDISSICNCSSCHCPSLRYVNTPGFPKLIVSSGFEAALDQDQCVACGACEPRCQVKAIKITDETVILDKDLCVGCGLCVSSCASGAITLEKRDNAPVPPSSRPIHVSAD